jgi:hypothetical protein
MRQVKALMIARHVLAGLWLLVWLTASPGAHARAISSGDFAPAFAATDGQGEQHGNDLTDLRFQALRASRRCDSQTDSTGNMKFLARMFVPKLRSGWRAAGNFSCARR